MSHAQPTHQAWGRCPWAALLILLAASSGCGQTSGPASPSTESDAAGDAQSSDVQASKEVLGPTHPDGPTRYDKLFGGDVVHDLVVTYRPGEWDKQQADMTERLGDFGANTGGQTGGPGGGGGGGGPGGGGPSKLPPQAYAACEGKDQGQKCAVTLKDGPVEGTCEPVGGALGCILSGAPPGGGGGGLPGGGGDLVQGDPLWVAVDLTFDGVPLKWAGLRYKGNSTLSSSWRGGVRKMPFRVTFDKFEDEHPETKNQRLWGFKKLTFAPAAKDSSFLRDFLAGEVLRDRGVASARAAFVRVQVDIGDGNGAVYAGLYIAIEDPSDEMMKAVFGDDDGNLYKPDGVGAAWGKFDETSFVKKNNEDDADWSDVKNAIEALHADRSDPAAWRQGLEAHLDVAAFLRWLAVNSAMQNWDTYGAMTHNYYLYGNHEDDGRLVWVPWDHNEAFTSGGKGLADVMHTNVGTQWPLIRYLLDDPVYRQDYRALLAESVKGAYAEGAFATRVQQLHDLIADDVAKETPPWTHKTSDAAFKDSVEQLVNHAASRRAAIAQALGQGG